MLGTELYLGLVKERRGEENALFGYAVDEYQPFSLSQVLQVHLSQVIVTIPLFTWLVVSGF